MKSQNTKSTDELQREVRQELQNVRRDIDELQGRMTPGQFIDDAIFHNRGRTPAATFEHLKRNPIGTTFLSLGTLMLMEDNEAVARSKVMSATSSAHSKVADLRERIKSHMPQKDAASDTSPGIGEKAKNKVNVIKNTVQTKVSGISEEIQGKVSDLKGATSSAVGDLKDTARDLKSSAQDKADELKDTAQNKISDLRDTTETKIDDIHYNFGESDEQFAPQSGIHTISDSDISTGSDESIKDKVSTSIGSGREKFSSALGSSKDKLTGALGAGREVVSEMDSMTFMALGAGLGALTGASLPVSEKERQLVDGKFGDSVSGFSDDLQSAINECSNILKDLVIQDVKNFTFKVL